MSEEKVPEVRFRGFSGEWESKLFSGVFDTTIPNNTLSRANLNYENGEVKNIHYGDVLIKFGEITNIKKAYMPFVTDIDIAKYKGHFLADGDIIFADTAEDATVGKATEITGIDEEKVVAGLHTIPARPRNLKPVGYLGYYINSDFYHKQLLALMQGIKVLSISKRNLANTSISYPFLNAEQTKIGEFFKNLDDLIAQNQKKYDKLVNMKKACLDKMFPKDGADTPEVRFQGFGGEWEKKELGTLYKKIRNAFVGTATPFYVENGNFYLESNNVKNGQINRNNQVFINDEFYLKQKDNWLHTDDLVVVQSGHVGHCAVIPPELDNTAAHALIIISIPTGNTVPHFVNYQFLNSSTKNNIANITTGNTIKHILSSGMKTFNIYVTDMQEQTQIGTFFQTLDNLITLQKTKLEKLKNIKKACLAKMFI